MGLNAKHEAFAKQVALQPGDSKGASYAKVYGHDYKAKRNLCDAQSSKLLKKPAIQERVNYWRGQFEQTAVEEFNEDANSVLLRMVEIDRMGIADVLDENGELLSFDRWPDSWQRYANIDIRQTNEGCVISRITFPDKQKNLEMLARGVGVFKDRADTGGAMSIADFLNWCPDPDKPETWNEDRGPRPGG